MTSCQLLAGFCDQYESNIRDYSAPFVVEVDGERHMYGCNGMLCVRMPAPDAACVDDPDRYPQVQKLDWRHESLSGWRPWPEQRYIEADYSECPTCDGHGTASGSHEPDCPTCEGFGCESCEGLGFVGARCAACLGAAIGIHASIQAIGGEFVRAKDDAKLRQLAGLEYVVLPSFDGSKIAIRFDGGGEGLLMVLRRASAISRIESARDFNEKQKGVM